MVSVTPALEPRTTVLPVDKIVDKLYALVVSGNLINQRNSGIFLIRTRLAKASNLPHPAPVPWTVGQRPDHSRFLSDNASKIGQSGRSSPWQAEANVLS